MVPSLRSQCWLHVWLYSRWPPFRPDYIIVPGQLSLRTIKKHQSQKTLIQSIKLGDTLNQTFVNIAIDLYGPGGHKLNKLYLICAFTLALFSSNQAAVLPKNQKALPMLKSVGGCTTACKIVVPVYYLRKYFIP